MWWWTRPHIVRRVPRRVSLRPLELLNVPRSRPLQRGFSSSSSSSSTSSPRWTKSWERSARAVKNTNVTNQYLEHLRDVHDPSLHVKTLEDEMKGAMGQALGRQAEKVVNAIEGMKAERVRYDSLLGQLGEQMHENGGSDSGSENRKSLALAQLRSCVDRHNTLRSMAEKARWELLVHRQAVGFVVDNHRAVYKAFPIEERLDVPVAMKADGGQNVIVTDEAVKKTKVGKHYGDQLDWWQRIGRWK